MIRLLTILFMLLWLTLTVSNLSAQTTDCPSGQVCVPQATADRLFKAAQELIEAREVIAKMLNERSASDATIASAMKVIDGWKQLDEVNQMKQVRMQQMLDLYEKTITLYASLVENLEKRLMRPKSAWSRFVDVLKNAAILLAGVSLGRGI